MSASCWLDGRLLPLEAARIDPRDRGLTLGDGVFETIAVRGGRPAHLARHLDRLEGGAAALGIALLHARDALQDALSALIASAGGRQGSVRITLTRGASARGLLPDPHAAPTLLMLWSGPAAAPDQVAALLCRCTRRNEASPLAAIKSLNYLDAILARREAEAAGMQDAVLLNTRGQVAEATSANLFALRAGVLSTPPLADGALPGITRALLIERAGAVEARLLPGDLVGAEALILTSSLGLRQLVRLDRTEYPARPDLLAGLRALIDQD